MAEYFETYKPILFNIGKAILIFVLGWLASKWTNRLTRKSLRKGKADKALSRFMASIAQYAVLAATVITSLASVGIQTTSLVAVFASAGLAIGLALQGSLSNFASGVMILFLRPFNLGDEIEAADYRGDVVDIGLFATSLITKDNKRIIIPNSSVTSNTITNYTVEGKLRAEIDVGVAYGEDAKKAMEVLIEAASKTELALSEPSPDAFFTGLGSSSLDFRVRAWCESRDYRDLCHNLRHAVYKALNEADIEIPFTQIVVHKAD